MDPAKAYEELKNEENKQEIQEDQENVALKKDDSLSYQIETEHEKGWCNLFTIHFGALFVKRIIQTRRNFTGFLVEIFIPILLIFSGLGLATIAFFKDSDARLLQVGLFPTQQRAMYNSDGFASAAAST